MARETGNGDHATSQSDTGVKRRGLLRFGTLLTAFTGASAISAIGALRAEAGPGDQSPTTTYVPMSEKGAPLGVATLDLESKVPRSLLPDLSATYATLVVVERPQRFYAGHYDTLADLFAARDATNGPAVIELEPLATYQGANLRIDKPDTAIVGGKATISLPPGANQDVLRIGPEALRLDLGKFNLTGNYATQTGMSRGMVFEAYAGGGFRFADRTAVEDVNIDGFLHDSAVVEERRLHVVFSRVFARDYGRYGFDIRSSDCRIMDGCAGGIRGQYGIRLNAGSNWVTGNGLYSNTIAGILMTEKANGVKVVNNDIDNNLGGGIRAVGLASDSLDSTIALNHFRGNSTSGDGRHSDIYLEQVSNLTLFGNRAYAQLGSAARTKYIVEAGAGVDSLESSGNVFQTAYPTLGRWNAAAATARKNRQYGVDFILDGSGDIALRRRGAGMEITSDFTSYGTMLAQRHSATGTGGQGFYQMVAQSATPGTPGANQSRIFSRDNGSGKTQICVLYDNGSIGVLHTQA